MLRRLFTLAAAVSLILCAAAVVLWVRSYRAADSVWWNGTNRVHAAVLSKGKLEFYFQQVNATAPFGVTANRGHLFRQPTIDMNPGGHQPLGFGFTTTRDANSSRQIALIPCWFPVAVAGALSAACLRARKSVDLRLHLLNRCVTCGYDLRATPDCCPECGTVPAGERV